LAPEAKKQFFGDPGAGNIFSAVIAPTCGIIAMGSSGKAEHEHPSSQSSPHRRFITLIV
jgi:hypothetical protein